MASWMGIEVPFWFVVAIGLGLVLLVSLLSLQVSEGYVSAVHLSEATSRSLKSARLVCLLLFWAGAVSRYCATR